MEGRSMLFIVFLALCLQEVRLQLPTPDEEYDLIMNTTDLLTQYDKCMYMVSAYVLSLHLLVVSREELVV
jgi:hypothetical protein